MSLRNVYLYGHLEEKYGREHSFDVCSVASVISALKCAYSDFANEMRINESYVVYCGDEINSYTRLLAEEYSMTSTGGDYHIVPSMSGGIGKSEIALVVGAALLFTPIGTFLLGAQISLGVGFFFLATGAAMSLTPVLEKKTGVDVENGESFVFSTPNNSARQGGIVPVIYGTHLVGSTVVSSYMEATNYIDGVEE